MAGRGDCLSKVGVVVDCDSDKALWRVLKLVYRPDLPKNMGIEESFTTGAPIAPYCSDVPGATGATWVDQFGIGNNLSKDKNLRYKVLCLEPVRR